MGLKEVFNSHQKRVIDAKENLERLLKEGSEQEIKEAQAQLRKAQASYDSLSRAQW